MQRGTFYWNHLVCGLIKRIISQASWRWQHICHIALLLQLFASLSPRGIIYVDMAVMTHYNSSCQQQQDAWFTGMSMSSVSLEPQATLMAQWPCGSVWEKWCVCAHLRVCFYLCLGTSVPQNVSTNAFIVICVCVSVVAIVNQSFSKSNIFRGCSQSLRAAKADWGWHVMYAGGKVVGVDLYNAHLIGLCLFLSASILCTGLMPPLFDLCLQLVCKSCVARRSPGRKGSGTCRCKVTSSPRARGTGRIALWILK